MTVRDPQELKVPRTVLTVALFLMITSSVFPGTCAPSQVKGLFQFPPVVVEKIVVAFTGKNRRRNTRISTPWMPNPGLNMVFILLAIYQRQSYPAEKSISIRDFPENR
jgi:hypothetical protein